MGRHGIPPSDAGRWVFNRLVEDYLARPPYPPALVERLSALAGPAGRVADLGAGTGHLALPLGRRGLRVDAVEPAEAMLRALSERAAGLPVRPVHAAAEETGLPPGAYALVLIADALHWIDPALAGEEARRLLAPGGAVAILEAAPAASPFMDDLSALLLRFNPRLPPPPSGRRAQLLSRCGAGRATAEVHIQEARLDGPGLAALLRSLSHVGPALGPERLQTLLAEARALAERHGGARWARTLKLTWARRA